MSGKDGRGKVAPLRGDLLDRGKEALLIRRASAGDRKAVEALLAPYEVPLLRYVSRLLGSRRRSEAADLIQACFIRVLEALGKIDPERPFRPYLYRIATNLVIDHVRREGRRGRFVGLFEGTEEARAASGRADVRVELAQTLGELPVQYRTVLALRIGEGLDYTEIAETLQIPVNTVRTYLFRARSALRKKLEGER